MHLIPESWAHWHILVSVFPSVGLVFVLGFYLAGMYTHNEGLKRLCLFLFGALAILAIPTYQSGYGAVQAVTESRQLPEGAMNAHIGWGWVGLTLLALTGIASWMSVFRRVGGLTANALHLVLGLSIATLITMMFAGETGWQINHFELELAQGATPNTGISGSDVPEGQGTPQSWSHVHMILNHFPTVGFVFCLTFFLTALVTNNDTMKRWSLAAFAACGILGASTYVTGAASMWALTDPPIPEISMAAINAHRDMALIALFGLGFTGGAAWFELWRYRYLGRFSNAALFTVLIFAVVTLAVMAETGHRGGQINHPEIRTEPLPTDASVFWTPNIELLINTVLWFVPWQTVHFFGYSLVFGTVTAVVLRVLGFWKSVPFSAVHRLLPLGVFGVLMNVFTGMLMLMADTFRYVNNATMVPKMWALPIAVIAVLYFSLSERVWTVKAGEEAPMTAKWVAVVVLLGWTAVIMGGRLLPYL